MGVSSRCKGVNLYNHLKQKNISISLDYLYDKSTCTWGGSLVVFDKTFEVANLSSKKEVITVLFTDSQTYIHSKINVKSGEK